MVMGMFDYVRCKYPLPVEGANDLRFQTKDTPAQQLDEYEITEDGKLLGENYEIEDHSDPNTTGIERFLGCMTRVNIRKEPVALTGEVRFYTSFGEEDEDGWGKGWLEFSAYFVKGELRQLEVIENRAT